MRRISNFTIDKETIEDMIKAGRYNQCLEITYRDRSGKYTHKLSAGESDVLDVYREAKATYILSTNSRFGYVGLEEFEGGEKISSIFFQGHQVKETLGSEAEDFAPFTIIKRLRRFI